MFSGRLWAGEGSMPGLLEALLRQAGSVDPLSGASPRGSLCAPRCRFRRTHFSPPTAQGAGQGTPREGGVGTRGTRAGFGDGGEGDASGVEDRGARGARDQRGGRGRERGREWGDTSGVGDWGVVWGRGRGDLCGDGGGPVPGRAEGPDPWRGRGQDLGVGGKILAETGRRACSEKG